MSSEHSLIPARRDGERRAEARRASAWEALSPCIVLDAVVGSRAWGLDDAQSDEDRRGAFVLPFAWRGGLGRAPTDLVRSDGSATYWELEKCVHQALRAEPNTLEMLFVPSVNATDELGAWLLEARDALVSRRIEGSFGRYAIAQMRRLVRGTDLVSDRAVVLGWLAGNPGLGLDEVAARLAESAEPPDVLAAKERLKQLYRSLHDRGFLRACSFEALAEFAPRAAALELPRELRPKNAYNLLRLMHTAIDWLATGTPTFRMQGAVRARLLAVKRGEVPMDAVLAEAEALGDPLARAARTSPLPEQPDLARADRLLRRVATECARRHVLGERGPLGRDAPEPPEDAWDDR